jgi:type I restriction enzyme S subunit
MSKRCSVQLCDVISVKHGFAFPGDGFTDDPSLPTLVTPGNFAIGGGFKPSNPKTFRGSFPEEYRLAPGDLIITMTDLSREGATLGLPAVVPAEGTYLHNQRIGLVQIHDSRKVEREFLHYYLRTKGYRAHILGTATGSTVRHTSPTKVCSFVADLPSADEQREIAEVLGALDDKIAANSKRTETIDQYLAAMFGEIRSRCEQQGFLRDVADINGDSVKPVAGGTLRYIDIASVGVGDYEYPAVIAWEEAPSRARRGVRKGDTIWSTVRPNRRSHALNLSADPLLVASTGLAVLSPREVGFAYLYEVTKHPAFTTYLESAAEGSAYPAVRADRFGDALIPMFPRAEHDGFEATAAPMRELAHSLEVENRTLSATRDALLPQLISGNIKVKDVEKTVDEVL